MADLLLTANSTAQLPGIAAEILSIAGDTRIFLFYGDMGAGKTTFIKSLCRALGVADEVTSPTFSIVNEYPGDTEKVYHFDFYRLKDESEALDMGYEEYFYSDAYCFIEWPEKIPGLLPNHFVKVTLTVLADGSRQINIEKF